MSISVSDIVSIIALFLSLISMKFTYDVTYSQRRLERVFSHQKYDIVCILAENCRKLSLKEFCERLEKDIDGYFNHCTWKFIMINGERYLVVNLMDEDSTGMILNFHIYDSYIITAVYVTKIGAKKHSCLEQGYLRS